MSNVASSTQLSAFFNIICEYIVDASVSFWNKFKHPHWCKIDLLPGDSQQHCTADSTTWNAVWDAEAAFWTLSIQQ